MSAQLPVDQATLGQAHESVESFIDGCHGPDRLVRLKALASVSVGLMAHQIGNPEAAQACRIMAASLDCKGRA